MVALQLDRPLFDSDEMIEERTGRTVREIWSTDGEAAFRALETETLVEALAEPEESVIAAAGGVVLSEPQPRAVCRRADAHVVWLLADVDVLVDRVRNGMHRPLLDEDPEGTLRADVRRPGADCTRRWRTPSCRSITDRSTTLPRRCCDAPGERSAAPTVPMTWSSEAVRVAELGDCCHAQRVASQWSPRRGFRVVRDARCLDREVETTSIGIGDGESPRRCPPIETARAGSSPVRG